MYHWNVKQDEFYWNKIKTQLHQIMKSVIQRQCENIILTNTQTKHLPFALWLFESKFVFEILNSVAYIVDVSFEYVLLTNV